MEILPESEICCYNHALNLPFIFIRKATYLVGSLRNVNVVDAGIIVVVDAIFEFNHYGISDPAFIITSLYRQKVGHFRVIRPLNMS